MAAKGNQSNLIHGGSAARQALTKGTEFTGVARDMELQIKANYDTQGAAELLKRDAIRIHTAGELYWSAILGAAEEGNMPKFESYVKTYGWLATAGARLLQQLIALEGKDPGAKDAAAILAEYKDKGGEDASNS